MDGRIATERFAPLMTGTGGDIMCKAPGIVEQRDVTATFDAAAAAAAATTAKLIRSAPIYTSAFGASAVVVLGAALVCVLVYSN